MSATALLTFSIGPVQTFIAQARRVADLWAGSELLSHLAETAIKRLLDEPNCALVFPSFPSRGQPPDGLPNRFVARVPGAAANVLAESLRAAVLGEWNRLVVEAVRELGRHDIAVSPRLWTETGSGRQTDGVLDIAWSWLPEDGGYAQAARTGADCFDASRRFRPFTQTREADEKCAVCGERTALPDGQREHVRRAWAEAATKTNGPPFFRVEQGRLCLVCATKRLYPRLQGRGREAAFKSFEDFEPAPADERQRPYFAVVAMDGDHMGQLLRLGHDRLRDGTAGVDVVEAFHRDVSQTLLRFANGLRDHRQPPRLDLEGLAAFGTAIPAVRQANGRAPQLIYAGGEDVLLLCDPRHAIPLARAIREAYRQAFLPLRDRLARTEDQARFTISAAVVFAHTKQPAGLVFEDARRLLKYKAKREAGRDALAVRLAKRGGAPVEVAFKWDQRAAECPSDGVTLLVALQQVTDLLRAGALASGQTFNLRDEEETLTEVLQTRDDWERWLRDRLRRGGASDEQGQAMAALIAPFFLERCTPALRIARFLGTELAS